MLNVMAGRLSLSVKNWLFSGGFVVETCTEPDRMAMLMVGEVLAGIVKTWLSVRVVVFMGVLLHNGWAELR